MKKIKFSATSSVADKVAQTAKAIQELIGQIPSASKPYRRTVLVAMRVVPILKKLPRHLRLPLLDELKTRLVTVFTQPGFPLSPKNFGVKHADELADLMLNAIGKPKTFLGKSKLRDARETLTHRLFELLIRNDPMLQKNLLSLAEDQVGEINSIIQSQHPNHRMLLVNAKGDNLLVNDKGQPLPDALQEKFQIKGIRKATDFFIWKDRKKRKVQFIDHAYICIMQDKDGNRRMSILVAVEIKMREAAKRKFASQMYRFLPRLESADKIEMRLWDVNQPVSTELRVDPQLEDFTPEQIVFSTRSIHQVGITEAEGQPTHRPAFSGMGVKRVRKGKRVLKRKIGDRPKWFWLQLEEDIVDTNELRKLTNF